MQPRQFLWTWKSGVPSVHFWYGTTATGIEIGPNGMSNKVLTTSKYSSWDRCQCLGRSCNCACGQARSLSTFEEYSQEMILPYITSQLETVSRVDNCLGQVSNKQPDTIYRITHSGTMQRQRVLEGAPIPANWEAFLRSNANKDELFRYMSECIHACETGRKVIISTKDETIVSTQNDVRDVEYLQPCSHEEADTGILLHVAHCARQGLRKLVIRTVDTYVVVLAIGHSPALRLDELWLRFGIGTHFRQLAIQEIV